MKYPQTFRNADGQERIVSSVDGKVKAEFEGFYAPDSPSGKRFTAAKAAETRKANAAKKAPAKPKSTTTRKRAASKATAPEGPTPEQVQATQNEAAAANAAASLPTP